ncbi:hypothetical protein DOY81_013045, partial [Sarcophaga bullata]
MATRKQLHLPQKIPQQKVKLKPHPRPHKLRHISSSAAEETEDKKDSG